MRGQTWTLAQTEISEEILNPTGIIDSMETITTSEAAFEIDKKQALDIIKAYTDIAGGKERIIILINKNNASFYIANKEENIEVFDTIDIEKCSAKEEKAIAFNPKFLLETLQIIDAETIQCFFLSRNKEFFIKGKEYGFILMPAMTDWNMVMENIKLFREEKDVSKN